MVGCDRGGEKSGVYDLEDVVKPYHAIYVAVVMVLLHFVWQGRVGDTASWVYSVILSILFVARFRLFPVDGLLKSDR